MTPTLKSRLIGLCIWPAVFCIRIAFGFFYCSYLLTYGVWVLSLTTAAIFVCMACAPPWIALEYLWSQMIRKEPKLKHARQVYTTVISCTIDTLCTAAYRWPLIGVAFMRSCENWTEQYLQDKPRRDAAREIIRAATVKIKEPSDIGDFFEYAYRRANPLATVPEDQELNGDYSSLEEAGLINRVVQQSPFSQSQPPELEEGERLDPGHLRAVLGWEVTQDDDGNQCRCCKRTFRKHDKILSMPCWQHHVFHERCERYNAFRRVRTMAKCPFCKTSILELDTGATTAT